MSSGAPTLKTVLKRGALVTAANWPVVIVQLIADATFQALFAVPVVGAAILVATLFGANIQQLLNGSLRSAAASVAGALRAQPLALGAFLVSFGLVVLGGSILSFLIKGGTVTVMVDASRAAGAIERPPLRMAAFRRAACFSLERFTSGCVTLFRPYLVLGLGLILVYAVTGAAFLAAVYLAYDLVGARVPALDWTMLAAMATILLIAWVSVVNLIYLLMQIAVAGGASGEGRQPLRAAARLVVGLLRHHLKEIAAVFGVVVLLVVAATAVSALAWSGVGLIAFVPVIGIAVVPLQLAALVVRGVVFEYLGLMALGAYLSLFRTYQMRGEQSAQPLPMTIGGM